LLASVRLPCSSSLEHLVESVRSGGKSTQAGAKLGIIFQTPNYFW